MFSESENTKKDFAFVIMALNKPDSELVWENVYKPTIESFGLYPHRISKLTLGSPLLEQIQVGINSSVFIIADLTHERPNCYFEVGYAFGLGKHDPTILCCRVDHDLHRTRSNVDPKIHFDLQGYQIVWWDPDKLEAFKVELEEVIRFRLKQLPPTKRLESKRMPNFWIRIWEWIRS